MPLNDKKIGMMIVEEARALPERYAGYRDDLVDALGDILEYERQHRVQGVNIQQRINDKIVSVGRLLVDGRKPGANH